MKICGPKYALCGLVLSVWGMLQLGMMGFFFFWNSVALIEDLPLEGEKFTKPEDFYAAAEKGFSSNAYNCFIAAFIYAFTFVFSGWQFYINSRSSLAV